MSTAVLPPPATAGAKQNKSASGAGKKSARRIKTLLKLSLGGN